VTFKLGTNPDTATVQTQNRVGVALPRLPPEVPAPRRGGEEGVERVSDGRQPGLQGRPVRFAFPGQLRPDQPGEPTGQPSGIGDSRLGSAQTYSMRVWVNPDKMAKLGLTATDVANAIGAQNRQNPAGSIGQAPSPAGTDFQYNRKRAGPPGGRQPVRQHYFARPAGRFPWCASATWAIATSAR